MMAPTHILAGLTLTGCLVDPSISIVTAGMAFSLIPDIDTPESFIGHKVPVLPSFIKLTLGHRTITHSLPFLLAGYFLFLIFTNKIIAMAWLLGVGSHILADMLTSEGVRLFWPHPARISIGFISTGSMIESVFVFILLFINIGTKVGRGIWVGFLKTITSFLKEIIYTLPIRIL